MSVAAILEQGFLRVGSWKTPDCSPYKEAVWLRYQSGLYAFAINDVVMYVGLSEVLHRRLRNYGNRAFRNKTKPQRDPHSEIAAAVAGDLEVNVYAKVMSGLTELQLLPFETALIVALQPAWNGTHRLA